MYGSKWCLAWCVRIAWIIVLWRAFLCLAWCMYLMSISALAWAIMRRSEGCRSVSCCWDTVDNQDICVGCVGRRFSSLICTIKLYSFFLEMQVFFCKKVLFLYVFFKSVIMERFVRVFGCCVIYWHLYNLFCFCFIV